MWPTEFDLLTGICVCLLTIFIVQILLKYRSYPPGPWGVPLIGFAPFLRKDFQAEQFKKLSDKYGDVFCFNLGQHFVVVLSSYEAVKEALIKQADNFAGRPQHFSLFNYFGDFKSVIVTDGKIWKEQRRFIISSLRDFGLGKLSIEGKIHEEIQVVLDIFRQGKLKSRELSGLFQLMITNVICSLCFGDRYDHRDKKLQQLMDIMNEASKATSSLGVLDLFSIFRYLPKSWTNLDKIEKATKELNDFVDEITDDHLKSFTPNNPRDVIDMYLDKQHDLGLHPQHSNSIYSRNYMRPNLTILFFAGTDTTANTLHWAMKLMTMYPEVQRRVQKEIDEVVGRSRLPSVTDRDSLPYIEATILEVHRMSSIVPLSVPHNNIEEATIKGFTIPRRSLILTNLYQIHYDPKLWKNPEEFNPTRFLNSDGKVVKPEYLMPFSAGKRFCLGESLAKMELFLFFTSILQNFTFRYEGTEPLGVDLQPDFFRKAGAFDAVIEPR